MHIFVWERITDFLKRLIVFHFWVTVEKIRFSLGNSEFCSPTIWFRIFFCIRLNVNIIFILLYQNWCLSMRLSYTCFTHFRLYCNRECGTEITIISLFGNQITQNITNTRHFIVSNIAFNRIIWIKFRFIIKSSTRCLFIQECCLLRRIGLIMTSL